MHEGRFEVVGIPFSSATTSARILDFAVAIFVAGTFLFGLGWLDLIGPDEGRHAIIARELIESGNWLVPTLHGLPYFDKPVFLHWWIALSTTIFGPENFAVRLPSALAGLWTVWVSARWADRHHGRVAARITALLLAVGLLTFLVAHIAIIDALLTALLATALWRFGDWFVREDGATPPSLWPGYAMVGLGLLAKGPIAAILSGLVVVAMCLVRKRPRDLLAVGPVRGGVLALAIATPFYLAAWWRSPVYIETFLFEHNLARYAVAGAVGHQEAWWYYFVWFPAALLPWVFSLVPALGSRWKRWRPVDLFPLVWALVVILFFLPSRARLVTYLLPAVPPLAVLAAAWLAEQWERREELPGWVARSTAVWIGLLAVLASLATLAATAMEPSLWIWTPLVLLSALALRGATMLWKDRGVDSYLSAMGFAHLLLVVFLVGPAAAYFDVEFSERPVARELLERVGPAPMVRSYGKQANSVAWYAGLAIPRMREPAEELDALVAEGLDALVVKSKHLADLEPWMASGLLEEVWRNYWGTESLVIVHRAAPPASSSPPS